LFPSAVFRISRKIARGATPDDPVITLTDEGLAVSEEGARNAE
jgi:hypothetical protein